MGLILPLLLPVKSWVLAQNELLYFSPTNTFYTSEFGMENPEGMAYAPETDSFIVWGKNKGNNAISLHNESSRKIDIPHGSENPLGSAFDEYSNSLFILDPGNTELVKTGINGDQLATRFNLTSLQLQDVQGMTFDPVTGRLFVLNAGGREILAISPHPVNGFNEVNAIGNNTSRVSLESVTRSTLRGLAFNPNNGHLYIGSPGERKIYELKETGEKISTYDVSRINLENPTTMLFAPSQDTTDDPNMMALYILDSGQPTTAGSALASDQRNTSQKGQIVELSMQAPAALPPGTTLLPSTLVRTFNTSNTAWNPSSPDPAGIDYWPVIGRLLIADSEVDEMPIYFQGKNVFLSTTSGALTSTCSTMSFTGEPTGVAINPNNNHIFFSTDFNDRIFEVSVGPDGLYCTSDDTLTTTEVGSLYRITDAEDVAYGNNTLFISGGGSAEVYIVPLGPNGVLGGGDDGAMTHFDTASLGFSDLEAIGYNPDSGTLFIASPKPTEGYLGEVTTSGTLLRAFDLSFMGSAGNIRSDVTYAPGSQNPATKNIYIASRGIDNDDNRNENDGKVWEIQISNVSVPTPTPVTPISANVQVNIGGSTAGNYQIPRSGSQRINIPGINGGPVEFVSTNGFSILSAMRTIWQEPGFRSSYSELMGLPKEQLSTEYWFPWYNNATPSMDQGFRIANVDNTSSHTIQVRVGSTQLESFTLGAGASIRKSYVVDNGPIRILCTDCTVSGKILAAMRVIWQEPGYRSSYSELMGLPKEQLSSEYWFPWYNNATPSMDQGFRIANVDTTAHTIKVFVGTTQVSPDIHLSAGASTRVAYVVNNGPVRIVCTDCGSGGKIITAMRVIWQEPGYRSSYSELMGLPVGQLSTEYWFPWYNSAATNSMDQGFRIAVP